MLNLVLKSSSKHPIIYLAGQRFAFVDWPLLVQGRRIALLESVMGLRIDQLELVVPVARPMPKCSPRPKVEYVTYDYRTDEMQIVSAYWAYLIAVATTQWDGAGPYPIRILGEL